MPDARFIPPTRVLFETLANDGRYMSRRRSEYVPPFRPLDLTYAEVPFEHSQRFGGPPPGLFGEASDHTVRIPLLPGVEPHLQDDLQTHPLGPGYPSSSLRTVLVDARSGLANWALKLHLPDAMRSQFATDLASKEISAADAMISPVYTALLARLDTQSPYLGIIEEPSSVVATIGRNGEEVGAIFRRLPEVDWTPGFSLYSPNRGALEESVGARPVGVRSVEATLGAAASRFDRIDRTLELYVDPLLDIFFSLASQGVTLQLHAQNILFEMNDDSTRRVWVRDLAGANYAPNFRAEHGLDDILTEAVSSVPGASQDLLQRWFHRQGQLRRRFEERFLFGHSYDAHLSPFIYQLMTGFWRAGLFGARDLKVFQVAVQRRAHAAAAHHDFDPDLLRPIATPREGLLGAVLRGLELRAVFRPEPA